MELCLGYEPGISSWGDTGEAIWLGETTSMELGYVPPNHYTRLNAIVNWRSGFVISFGFLADCSPERKLLGI
jgi:hypothetical protein